MLISYEWLEEWLEESLEEWLEEYTYPHISPSVPALIMTKPHMMYTFSD